MENNKSKGFTLAELLIVVAIIAVLVAVSIPIFSGQLEKARRAVDLSNARSIQSVFANAINDGSFVFNNKSAELFVYIGRTSRNGGFTGNSGGVITDLMINGVTYHGNGKGQALVWRFLEQNGIAKGLTMKQKNSAIDWYGVSINGYGQSYYYEGKFGSSGTKPGNGSSKKYAWSDLNTPEGKHNLQSDK